MFFLVQEVLFRMWGPPGTHFRIRLVDFQQTQPSDQRRMPNITIPCSVPWKNPVPSRDRSDIYCKWMCHQEECDLRTLLGKRELRRNKGHSVTCLGHDNCTSKIPADDNIVNEKRWAGQCLDEVQQDSSPIALSHLVVLASGEHCVSWWPIYLSSLQYINPKQEYSPQECVVEMHPRLWGRENSAYSLKTQRFDETPRIVRNHSNLFTYYYC